MAALVPEGKTTVEVAVGGRSLELIHHHNGFFGMCQCSCVPLPPPPSVKVIFFLAFHVFQVLWLCAFAASLQPFPPHVERAQVISHSAQPTAGSLWSLWGFALGLTNGARRGCGPNWTTFVLEAFRPWKKNQRRINNILNQTTLNVVICFILFLCVHRTNYRLRVNELHILVEESLAEGLPVTENARERPELSRCFLSA